MQSPTNVTNVGGAGEDDNNVKAQLAAEIQQIEAALQAKRLQDEIKAMEAAIATASGHSAVAVKANPAPRTRKVRKVRRKKREPVVVEPPQSEADNAAASAAQRQLQDEIKAMETAIMAESAHRRRPLTEEEELQAEIQAMEAQIRCQTAARKKPVPILSPHEQLQAQIRAMDGQIRHAAEKTSDQVDYVHSHDYPESDDEFYDSADDYTVESFEEEVLEEAPVVQAAATTTPPPVRAAMPNLFAALASAATAREQRIEETGEMQMAEHVPEVDAQRQTTPQLSTSMAELVAKKAAERDARMERGEEKRMTVIKEKVEYKADFSDICVDAAKLGRLTRLNEHCVEAVAGEKQVADEWKSAGLLAIQWRSNHMSVIHEAAQAGVASRMPENIVSNCPEAMQNWDENDIDKPLSPRMQQLLELNAQVGMGQDKVDNLVMGRKEERGKPDQLLIKPMAYYESLDDVILPVRHTPKIDPKRAEERYRARMQAAQMEHRPLVSISNDVATIAWERRTRLDRPGNTPKIKEKCPCPYCFDASPFQTFAYKEKERKMKEEGYESPDPEEDAEREREALREARRQERQAQYDAEQAAQAAEYDEPDLSYADRKAAFSANTTPQIPKYQRRMSIRQALDEADLACLPAEPMPDPGPVRAGAQGGAPVHNVPVGANAIPSTSMRSRMSLRSRGSKRSVRNQKKPPVKKPTTRTTATNKTSNVIVLNQPPKAAGPKKGTATSVHDAGCVCVIL